jgi:glyoxylase-like metal-dependent hydrolase (beta-lactamase superfamily II)
MIEGAISQVEPNVYYLDSRRVSRFGVSGVYLVVGDGLTLIETATSLIAPYILEAAARIGFRAEDIRRAIVTHIHLDHAGGTGWLARRLPDLRVWVHERGRKHLHDPSALVESAKLVYGDLDTITAVHGEVLPVPEESLVPVRDEALDIGGGMELRIVDAPGHASHHLCVLEPESGCLFSGEALGHNHPETGTLQPAVAPPGFDFEASRATAAKLRDLRPRTICFSQFGQRRDASFVIDESERQLEMYRDFILTRMRRGLTTEQIMEEVSKLHAEERPETPYDSAGDQDGFLRSMLVSIVVGYQTYFQRSGLVET